MSNQVSAIQPSLRTTKTGTVSSPERSNNQTTCCNPEKTSSLYDLMLPSADGSSGVIEKLLKLFPLSPPQTTLKPQIVKDEQNNSKQYVQVKTADGYVLDFLGKNAEWRITSPDGKTTRIWGDPHVVESDGDKWDFSLNSTFSFGDNKVTVETTPAKNGTTLSKTVTVYNGSDRFTITDLETAEPKILGWKLDAHNHDTGLPDGDLYLLKKEKNGDDEWKKQKSQ